MPTAPTAQAQDLVSQLEKSLPALLRSEDLADLLGEAIDTMYNRQYRQPERLPVALRIPGVRGLRYTRHDVIQWLLAHRQEEPAPRHPQPAAPRRRGRPRKSDANK